jgi:hypothetical protein
LKNARWGYIPEIRTGAANKLADARINDNDAAAAEGTQGIFMKP